MNLQAVYLFLAFIISMMATLGSLFFSEVMGYPPCILCWYQRICMYPLVLIIGAANLFPAKNSFHFAFPLTLIGWLIAVYHNLLYYKILPESEVPCREGISCTTVFFEYLNFITIPSLSFFAFTFIGILLILTRRNYE